MPQQLTSFHVLNSFAETLVVRQKYRTPEDALRGLALAAVQEKTRYYRRRIHRLEKKYGLAFDDFTSRLRGRATPKEEDDWLEWHSALDMLADWQTVYQDLSHAAS